jgi:hypothetical protein
VSSLAADGPYHWEITGFDSSMSVANMLVALVRGTADRKNLSVRRKVLNSFITQCHNAPQGKVQMGQRRKSQA